MSFWDLFSKTVGVDPGSESLRIVHAGQIIFNEPSKISFDKEASKFSGFGNSCVVNKKHVLISPMYFSIWDFYAFEMLLRSALKKGLNAKGPFYRSLKMFFAIPTGSNEIEKRAYRDSGEHANAVEVYMMHQSVCAAISLNILLEKKHFILIDFSASKVEITCFIDGLIYSTGLARMGTWKIYELIVNHLRRKYHTDVTQSQVSQALHGLESFNDMKVSYVDIADQRVPIAEIKAVLKSYFEIVNDALLSAIEYMTNYSHYQKVLANGIFFTGGGSLINCFREQILSELEITRTVSRTPFLDNINGLKIAMANTEKYKNYFMF